MEKWLEKKIKAMDQVQSEAVQAWIDNGFRGTVASTTG